MVESVYRGQFLRSVEARDPGDGRHLVDAALRKIHARGPTAPDSLAKRARPEQADDSAIRNIAKTSAQIRLESYADAALQAVRKCLATPTGTGPFIPEQIRKAPSTRAGSKVISARAVERMLGGLENLRKDSRTPPALSELPRGSWNGADIPASPTRAGGVASSVSGYSTNATPAGNSRLGPPSAAAVTAGRAGPQDDDIDGKRKGRRDEDEAIADRSDITLKAIRRALRPENAARDSECKS